LAATRDYTAKCRLFDLQNGSYYADFQFYVPQSKIDDAKGEWKGELFLLQPWQKFIVMNLFGFYKSNGQRKYRRAYIEVPKKNGKSPLAAAIMNVVLLENMATSPEMFSVATELSQAEIAWSYSYDMLEGLCEDFEMDKFKFTNSHNNKVIKVDGGGYYKPISFDEKARKDGFSVSAGLVDEYHAHKTDSMYNILSDGIAARKNPLILAITTAGENRYSPCYVHRNHCVKVLSGAKEDDALFSIIYTLDRLPNGEWEDWTTIEAQKKSNPNWGVSVMPEYFETRLSEAIDSETKKQSYQIKNLNIWQDAGASYVSQDRWELALSPMTEAELKEYPCYLGADLAATRDYTAKCRLFDLQNGSYYADFQFYVPQSKIDDAKGEEAAKMRGWKDAGYLTVTPGNATDYDYIKNDILDDFDRLNVVLYGYDPHNASQLIIDLQKSGLDIEKMTPVRQGWQLSTAAKEFERLSLSNSVLHGVNPIFNWMLSNVMIFKDNKENYILKKQDENAKIDGVISLLNALFLALESNLNNTDANEWFTPHAL